MLQQSVDRYPHVTTLSPAVDDSVYTLRVLSLPSVLKWHRLLPEYARKKGTRLYVDLISPEIAHSIATYSRISVAYFYNLSNEEALEVVLEPIRPLSYIEWKTLFTTNMHYSRHSAVFIRERNFALVGRELLTFTTLATDTIHILGPKFAPSQKDIQREFFNMLPDNIQVLFRTSSLINARSDWLTYATDIAEVVQEQITIGRQAAHQASFIRCHGSPQPGRISVSVVRRCVGFSITF